MKLGKRNKVLVSFMLFSLFFGAGNLIFPPFLGQNAGSATLPAMLGFLLTAVVLPVLGCTRPPAMSTSFLWRASSRATSRSIVTTVMPGMGSSSCAMQSAVVPASR